MSKKQSKMETTIIRLEPSTTNAPMTVRTTANFEEAFGEFSEARGKGRARRKKKKLSRIADRDEVKRARNESRIARRSDRKGKRQDIRANQQEARMSRRQRRLSMRQERQDAKQTRKDTRARGEQERENYAQEQELYRESLQPQEDGGSETPEDYGNEMTDNEGYASEDSGYPDDSSSGGYTDSEDWNTAPEGYDSNEDYYEDESYGEDGDYSEEDYGNEEEGDYYNADGDVKVSPRLVEHLSNIEEEKRQVSDLMARRNMMAKVGTPTVGIDMQIERRMNKIRAMLSKIVEYSNADGDASKRKMRKAEVRKAREQVNPNANRRQRRMRKRDLSCQHGGSETPVDADLNPQFSPNKIVVPSKMKSSFEGETGYDDIMDSLDDFDYDTMTENGRPVIFDNNPVVSQPTYAGDDYPTPRVYELQSNFTGEGKVVWKSIAIGVGLGVLALYLAKKYKILK